MKILVIEDSERLLRSLGRGLTKAGYAVDLAADGKVGLAFAETYDYEAIVLDLMLPGLPGLEVLRQLRAAGRDTHVLILSAKDRVEDRIKGLELGADDYLVKPFSFDELCARLHPVGLSAFSANTGLGGASASPRGRGSPEPPRHDLKVVLIFRTHSLFRSRVRTRH